MTWEKEMDFPIIYTESFCAKLKNAVEATVANRKGKH
jgi:hypothetical protein